MTGGNAKQQIWRLSPKGQNKPAGQGQRKDCAPPKLVGLSTEGQAAASVPTNHVTVAAFHLFWST